MKAFNRNSGLLLFCAGWLLCGAPVLSLAQSSEVAVVVNDSNKTTELSLPELRKILAGERRSWPGGASVKLFVRPSGTHERAVLLKLLGMSESEYTQYWTAQVFRGEAQSEPIVLPSNGMQKEAVLLYPGAIALMEVKDVKPGLKVLKVNGRTTGEPTYPLK